MNTETFKIVVVTLIVLACTITIIFQILGLKESMESSKILVYESGFDTNQYYIIQIFRVGLHRRYFATIKYFNKHTKHYETLFTYSGWRKDKFSALLDVTKKLTELIKEE